LTFISAMKYVKPPTMEGLDALVAVSILFYFVDSIYIHLVIWFIIN